MLKGISSPIGLLPPSSSISGYGLGYTAFVNRLEKHIDDTKKGQGYLSEEVDTQLFNRSVQANEILTHTDPKASTQFNAYTTAFAYDKKARFVSGVSQAAQTTSQITATLPPKVA